MKECCKQEMCNVSLLLTCVGSGDRQVPSGVALRAAPGSGVGPELAQ